MDFHLVYLNYIPSSKNRNWFYMDFHLVYPSHIPASKNQKKY